MMKPTLLLLAAGMGSRYGGLKQLDHVGPNGEILMDYSVFDAIRAGFGKVVFVIRKDIEEAFKREIGNRYAGKIEVAYAFQRLDDLPGGYSVPAGREKPWGTGQAAYAARELIHEPFALLNADDFYGRHCLAQVAKALVERPEENCLCGFFLENTLSENGSVSRGICRADADGFLAEVVEHTKLAREADGKVWDTMPDGSRVAYTGKEIASMNCWGFQPSLFERLGAMFEEFLAQHGTELKSEFYVPFVAETLIERKLAKFRVYTSEDSWLGITYRDDKPVVTAGLAALHASGVYPAKLF